MGEYKPCPKCGDDRAALVSFTWWGGLLGPKLLAHVQCPSCRNCYNGKTGASNDTGIVIYTVVALGIVGVLIFFAYANKVFGH